MPDTLPDEARLAADIDRLKTEFPKTRELYREVCALMFFRYGITPTANRLYQLVHRGSMGTPTAVLAEFWSDLREKSRVRIEHADLPEDLQGAAGEFIGALWTRATTAAQASLGALRDEVEQARKAAEASVAAHEVDLERTETALEQRTSALLAAQVRIHELEQAQAAAESTRGALEGEIARLGQAGADLSAQLERQRASTELAETRLQASEKRAQLEIERERTANARLQREFESAAKRAARFEEGARTEIQSLQAQLGDLRHRAGVLEGHLDALRTSHGAQAQELESLRQKPSGAGTTGTAARSTDRAAKSAPAARKRATRS